MIYWNRRFVVAAAVSKFLSEELAKLTLLIIELSGDIIEYFILVNNSFKYDTN